MIRFLRLRIEGYGRFRDPLELHFAPGLNLITGANESGKSTVLAALLDALYTSPTSAAQEVRERIHWGHPDGWRLELELEVGNQQVRLAKFHPTEDPRKRGEFLLERAGQVERGNKAQVEWERLWNMPKELYLATACIRQREMARLTQDKSLASLQQQLRESAVATDLEPIYREIQKHLRTLRTQSTRIDEERAQLSETHKKARLTTQQRNAYREQLTTLQEQMKTLTHQIAQEETLLQRWKEKRQLLTSLENLQQEVGKTSHLLQQLEALSNEQARIQEEIQRDYGLFMRVPPDYREGVRADYERYQRARQQEQSAVNQLNALNQQSQRLTGQRRARVGLVVMGVAMGLAGFVFLTTNALLGWGLLGLGAGTVLAGLLWRPKGQAELEAMRQVLEAHYQEARAERTQAEQSLVEKLHAVGIYEVSRPSPERNGGEYDLSVGFASAMARFEERWTRYKRLMEEQTQLSAQYQALAQTHSLQELRQRHTELSTQIVGLRHNLEADPIGKELLNTPAEEWVRREENLANLKRRLDDLRNEFHRTEGQLHATEVVEDPEAIQLQLQQAQARYDYLQGRIRLLETTEKLLREANRRYLNDLNPRLKPRIERYLGVLTQSRYCQVEIGDELVLRIYHTERGDHLLLDERSPAWSAGTLDQLFFACRLGLTDALSNDSRVPLLLDDPFVYSDEARLREAMCLLSQVAQQTQVLYFTCRPLPEVEANVIPL